MQIRCFSTACFPLLLVLVCTALSAFGQDHTHSFGLFGGVSVPITIDDGLLRDPRFRNKVTFRGIPIGLSYSYDDYDRGIGVIATPSYTPIGQQYIVSNIVNGDVGTRDIRMDYIALPVAFKFRVINLSFVRLYMLAAVSVNYLARGQETLTFLPATLRYPSDLSAPDRPGYTVRPDGGVATPGADGEVHVSQDKFNPIQVFTALGIRFEIDISEKWGVGIDARGHYGLFDPRTSAYKQELSQLATDAPDLPGERRDLYVSVTLGVAYIVPLKTQRRSIKSVSNKPLKKEKFKRPRW